jgi:hypothetical protein
MRCASLAFVLSASLAMGACALDSGVPSGESGTVDAGSTDAPIYSDRRLCDGSDHLRLAFFAGGGGPPSGPPYTLYGEVGSSYLYVDGHCRYWVDDPEDYRLSGRTGVLDAALEERLTRELHYQSWPALAGPYACQTPPPPDSGWSGFRDATYEVSCASSCGAPEIAAACTAQPTLAHELFDRGVPLDGPVRLYLVASSSAPPDPVTEHTWPLASDPVTLASDESVTPVAVRIDDLADADTLRRLKAEAIPASTYIPYVAIHRDGAPPFQLWVRDVLPFEDAPNFGF